MTTPRKPRIVRAKCGHCPNPADVHVTCHSCERAGIHCIDCALDLHGSWHHADWKTILDVKVDH